MQFRLLSQILNRPTLAIDPRFESNALRVANRKELVQLMQEALAEGTREEWLEKFRGKG